MTRKGRSSREKMGARRGYEGGQKRGEHSKTTGEAEGRLRTAMRWCQLIRVVGTAEKGSKGRDVPSCSSSQRRCSHLDQVRRDTLVVSKTSERRTDEGKGRKPRRTSFNPFNPSGYCLQRRNSSLVFLFRCWLHHWQVFQSSRRAQISLRMLEAGSAPGVSWSLTWPRAVAHTT